jgi:hypothetical protein
VLLHTNLKYGELKVKNIGEIVLQEKEATAVDIRLYLMQINYT